VKLVNASNWDNDETNTIGGTATVIVKVEISTVTNDRAIGGCMSTIVNIMEPAVLPSISLKYIDPFTNIVPGTAYKGKLAVHVGITTYPLLSKLVIILGGECDFPRSFASASAG